MKFRVIKDGTNSLIEATQSEILHHRDDEIFDTFTDAKMALLKYLRHSRDLYNEVINNAAKLKKRGCYERLVFME